MFSYSDPRNSIKRNTTFQCRNRESTQKDAKGGKDILKKSGEKRSLAEICVVGKNQGVVTCPRL